MHPAASTDHMVTVVAQVLAYRHKCASSTGRLRGPCGTCKAIAANAVRQAPVYGRGNP